MKKKDLKLIKKEKFDNLNTRTLLCDNKSLNKISFFKKKFLVKFKMKNRLKIKTKLRYKKKNKRFARILYLISSHQLKLRKIFKPKYSFVYKYFNFFKSLVFKKEFFFFKNFFLKFQIKNNLNIIIFPHFVFEKQFLFKFGEYQSLMDSSTNSAIFIKKKYSFFKNPGLNYWINSNTNIENVDPKDPVFYFKDLFEVNSIFVDINLINFNYNLNLNIFFFILVDIYKMLVLLHFKNIVN